ncbi:MAG: hypothetical protein U0T73_12995 [Chitinophagales bacterium]
MLSFFTYIVVALIGVMMGTIYKRSFTNIALLQFNPATIQRIFLTMAVIGVLICGFLSYKAVLAFNEKTLAEDKMNIYNDYESMLIYFLNLGFIVLIFVANLHSFSSKKIQYASYLITFGIYAAFAVIDNFFLEDVFFQFKKFNQLWRGEFSFANIAGYFSLFLSAVLTAFNAYMVQWGLKK